MGFLCTCEIMYVDDLCWTWEDWHCELRHVSGELRWLDPPANGFVTEDVRRKHGELSAFYFGCTHFSRAYLGEVHLRAILAPTDARIRTRNLRPTDPTRLITVRGVRLEWSDPRFRI